MQFKKGETSISPNRILSFLSYDPETGIIKWNHPTPDKFRSHHAYAIFAGQHAGKQAFKTERGNGYLCGQFDGNILQAHRVAWCIYNSEWPNDQIDHINGIKSDNRISNLRESSNAENNSNREMLSNNTSGFKGVSWHKASSSWRVSVRGNGSRIVKDGFNCALEAAKTYDELALKMQGRFAVTNSSMGLI